jgi:hypothetical protein
MKKKLLGLSFALGITALASWATPAVATDIPGCNGRFCGSAWDKSIPCSCPAYTTYPGKVVTCASFMQGTLGGCWNP